jgi:type I restriction enzyme S subunit
MKLIKKMPIGWKIERLDRVACVQTGLAKNSKQLKEWVELPYLRVANVQDGYLDLSEVKYVKVEPGKVDRYALQHGDVLMTEGGDFDKLGRGAVWYGKVEKCLHQNHVFAVRPDRSKMLSEFLSALTGSYYGKKYFLSCSKQSTNLASINSSQLKAFPVLLPPLPEQKAIADVLSTWDAAIEKTERLIEAKERRFRYLLNDLIHEGRSNQTWRRFNLGDLCKPVVRKNAEGNTNVLTSSAKRGLVSQLEYYNKSVSAENVTGYYLLHKGEFAYNRSSAKGYPFGATKRLDTYEKGVLSTLYLCFDIKPNAPCASDFLLHLFESGAVNRELRAVCQEGARSHGLLNITKSDFFSIKLFLPSLDQQKQIQAALNSARDEVNVLQKILERYKTQKRGLMQKLLTGEWRATIT